MSAPSVRTARKETFSVWGTIENHGQLTAINQNRKFPSFEGGHKLLACSDVCLTSQESGVDTILAESIRQIVHMRNIDTKDQRRLACGFFQA